MLHEFVLLGLWLLIGTLTMVVVCWLMCAYLDITDTKKRKD
jgi:hypothetical protein